MRGFNNESVDNWIIAGDRFDGSGMLGHPCQRIWQYPVTATRTLDEVGGEPPSAHKYTQASREFTVARISKECF